EDRDFRPETPPDAAELQADDARPDHAEALRDRREGERPLVVADDLVVDDRVRQLPRLRPGRDDHVLRLDRLLARLDRVAVAAALELAEAADPLDLVLLEEELDALRHLGDDGVLARLHLRHVDLDAGDRDAVRVEMAGL